MKIFIRFILLLSVTVLCTEKINAQGSWHNYPDGRTVNVIKEQGPILWIGTSGGLVRYDTITGNKTFYNRGNSPLPHNQVRSLAIDNQGRKWIGTNDGLACFDGINWTLYNSANSGIPPASVPVPLNQATDEIMGLQFDNAGVLWLAVHGLTSFDGVNWVNYSTANSNIVSNNVTSLTIDAAGNKWVGTLNGLSRFNGSTFTNYLSSTNISCLVSDHVTGLLWIGTGNVGVKSFNGSTFTTYDQTTSNLPNNQVMCITKHHDGNIWVGTQSGLARLEGTLLNHYNFLYYPVMYDPITAICIAANGDKFLGVSDSIVRFHGRGWSRYINGTGLPGSNVQCVGVDINNNRWVGTASGLARFNGTTWTQYTTANSSIPGNDVEALATDSVGNVWVGTTTGLAKFNGTVWTIYTTANGLANNSVAALACDQNGNTWVGFGNGAYGLQKFDGTLWTTYTPANSTFTDYYVRNIAVDASGNIWAATAAGVARQSGSTWITYSTSNSPVPSNQVMDVAIDDAGMIWVATLFGGLVRFDGVSSWTIYNNTNSPLPSNNLYDLATDHNGELWIGTTTNGVVRKDGNTWYNYTNTNSGLTSMDVRDIIVDRIGFKWFAVNGGAYRFDDSAWRIIDGTSSSGLTDNYVTEIAIDNADVKWFGTYLSDELIRFDGTTWTPIVLPVSIGGAVYAVTTENNFKWVGTAYGLGRYNGSTWTTYTTSNSPLLNGNVRDIAVDPAGVKWLGVYGGGLQSFDGASTWTNYMTYNSGILSNFVTVVLLQDSLKWVGTNNGLSRFNGTTWTNYTYLNSPLPNGEIQSLAADTNGAVWIGTPNGVAKLDTNEVWTVYTTSNSGLPENGVGPIQIDANGMKWIGTAAGLSSFDDVTWTNYNINNSGLAHNYVADIVADQSGSKWIAGANVISYGCGVSHFNPSGFPNVCTLTTSVANSPLCDSASCNGSATVNATGNGPLSYAWFPGGNTTSTITNSCVGTYTVLTLDNAGCNRLDTITIGVLPPVVVAATISNDSICTGDTAAIAASGATNFSWQPGNMSGSNVNVNPAASTTYTVIGTNAQGCADTISVSLTVNPLPMVTASSSASAICSGTPITLNGNPALINSWSGGVSDNVPFVPTTNTTFTVTGTDANGCSDTASVAVVVNALPVVLLSLPIDTLCQTIGTITLSGETPSGGTFSGPAVSAGQFDPSTAGIGMHTLTYTYTDVNGCSETASDSIYVDICMNTSSLESSAHIVVVPNPGNGSFTLLLNSTATSIVTIYDAQGKVVSTWTVRESVTPFILTTPGVYIISVLSHDGTQNIQRVVVTE